MLVSIENDCYVCDIDGNVYSVCSRQLSKAGNLVEKYAVRKLKGSVDRYGYVTYRITVGGEKKHLKGHRLMLNAWLGEQPNLVVNHIDGNKKNNALCNGALAAASFTSRRKKEGKFIIGLRLKDGQDFLE